MKIIAVTDWPCKFSEIEKEKMKQHITKNITTFNISVEREKMLFISLKVSFFNSKIMAVTI